MSIKFELCTCEMMSDDLYGKIKERDSFIKGIVDQNNPNLQKGIKELKYAIQNNPFLKSFHKELSALN